MLNIERVTDCKVRIDCEKGNGNPIAVVWQQGAMKLTIHSGAGTVTLTRSQLLQLAEVTPQIAADLVPELPKKE